MIAAALVTVGLAGGPGGMVIGIGIAGAVVAGLAAYLWLTHRRRTRPAAELAGRPALRRSRICWTRARAPTRNGFAAGTSSMD